MEERLEEVVETAARGSLARLHRSDAGDASGEIVACGTPEEVAENPRSFTGHFLRRVLHLPAVAG